MSNQEKYIDNVKSQVQMNRQGEYIIEKFSNAIQLFTSYKYHKIIILIQCILFSRDNGISLQIQMYQLWSEIFVFIIYLFLAFLLSFFNRINRMLIGKVSQLVIQFIVYVVQPLFYLHGEASFRNSCINQGIYHALKRALFDHYTMFHINNTVAPHQNMS